MLIKEILVNYILIIILKLFRLCTLSIVIIALSLLFIVTLTTEYIDDRFN